MRIAVPTNDGTRISEHFGRSAAFLVFEIENGRIQSRELRPNGMQHSHEQGSCGHGSQNQGQHSHAGILETLAGCDTVICTGMGARAAEALQTAGVTTVVAAATDSAENMIASYLKGDLAVSPNAFCRCRH